MIEKVSKNLQISIFKTLVFGFIFLSSLFSRAQSEQPNIIFIMADDFNQFMGNMNFYEMAKTPNLDRLANRGTLFTNAHSNAPVCAPSRPSLLTGIYPHTSKQYGFTNWRQNEVLANTKTIMEQVRDNGYATAGVGKLMHHTWKGAWDSYGLKQDYTPLAYNGNNSVGHPSVPEPYRSIGTIDGTFARLSDVPTIPAEGGNPGHNGWYLTSFKRPFKYVKENNRDKLPDELYTDWALNKLTEWEASSAQKPFFLGIGYIRPHTPLVVPDRFFDMFPIDEIVLPVTTADDENDTFLEDQVYGNSKGRYHFNSLVDSYDNEEIALKTYMQAYLASVAFMDEEVGRILDAIDNGPFKDNTVIIFTSDHGYTMGEKNNLFKGNLWESSTRVPLIISDLRTNKASKIDEVVSLIDLYPTISEISNSTADSRKNEKGHLPDGKSLIPLLNNEKESFADSYALTVVGGRHFSLKTSKWRYIMYSNGSEELYDQEADINDVTNLAKVSGYESIREDLNLQLNTILNPAYNTTILDKEFEDSTLSGNYEILKACTQASEGEMIRLNKLQENKASFNGVVAPETGDYLVNVSYFLGGEDVPMSMVVNGEINNLIFPSKNWCYQGSSATLTVIVPLDAGTNDIVFYPNGQLNAPFLDKITIYKDVSNIDVDPIVVNLESSKTDLSLGEELALEVILDKPAVEAYSIGVKIESEISNLYTLSSNALTIYKGTNKGKFVLKINESANLEEDTTIKVTLMNPSTGIVIGNNKSVTLNISNKNLGVNDVANKIKFGIYPNPTALTFALSLKPSEINKVKLISMNGRVYTLKASSNNKYNISHLSKGVYIIQVKTKNGTVLNEKIIIGKNE
tara:strand:- start:8065 stop:10629 length:2565 start_codon:yes stop_codon:yes gene_type:complete